MILLDNSWSSINGDYIPTRFDSQSDAATTIFNRKTLSNAENVVGLMTMAGKSPEVLVTPTQAETKVLSALAQVSRGGEIDLVTSIQVAQLALKHRQNKNQRQRIVVFVASRLHTVSTSSLVKLGKKMKKNNVALDIISLGEYHALTSTATPSGAPSSELGSESEATRANEALLDFDEDGKAVEGEGASESNEEKLRSFVESVNSRDDNSHLLVIPPGPRLVSDIIISSSVLSEDNVDGGFGDATGAGESGGAGGDEFGVDPSLDPELAMALRMSLEEERARQAAASNPTSSEPRPDDEPSAVEIKVDTTPVAIPAKLEPEGDVDMESGDELDEDEELARALAMSHDQDEEEGEDEDEEMDEEEAIKRAIEMSMKEDKK